MPLLCRIKEWKRKQGRSKCSCISPIDVSFFDTWMDICFPLFVFILWIHNCLLDYLYRILWSLEGLRVIFVNAGLIRRMEGIFVEWKTNQGSNVIQRRRTGQCYFQQLDHNIIRKIKLGEIDSLSIILSWVNEEDNSGGLSSLSRIKTQLNRWWLHWGRFIFFLSDWISDPIISPCFLRSLSIGSVKYYICDPGHRVLEPDLFLIHLDLSQNPDCFDPNLFANFTGVATRPVSVLVALSTRSAVGTPVSTTQFAHCLPALT